MKTSGCVRGRGQVRAGLVRPLVVALFGVSALLGASSFLSACEDDSAVGDDPADDDGDDDEVEAPSDSEEPNDDPEPSTPGDASSGDGEPSADAGDGPSEVEVPSVDIDVVACPSDEADLAEAFAEAVCGKRSECCDDDYEVCIVEVTEAFDAIYVDLSEAVAADTAAVDCESFGICAVAIGRASCDEWPAQVGDLAEIPVDVPECRTLVTPALQPGDDCSWNYECEAGFCRSEDGLCYAFAEENAVCEDSLCDLPTMFCNAAGLCQQRLDNGVVCTDSAHCRSGICDLDDTGTCIAPGAAQCEYVPSAPATCSARAASRGSLGFAGLTLLGLAFIALSRRFVRRERETP